MDSSQANSSTMGLPVIPYEAREVYEPMKNLGETEGHLCQRLLQGQILPSISDSRCYNKPKWLAPLLEKVGSISGGPLHRWGLTQLLVFAKHYNGMLIHWDAIGALVELWHPQTHTFLFTTFEATILLEEVELFLGLKRPAGNRAVAHCMEPLDTMEFLSQLTGDRLQARNIRTSSGIRLSRLASWVMEARDVGVDDEKIAKALSICLAGLFLFPYQEDIFGQEHLGAMQGVWRGRSLAHPVLAHLYCGLSSASVGRPLHGCVLILDIWISLHIKMIHGNDPSDKRLRTYKQTPISILGPALHFKETMVIKTLKLQSRENWRNYLIRLAPSFFTFYSIALGKLRLKTSPCPGVDLRLVGSRELVLYNAHRCHLQLGMPRHVIPKSSHYPPIEPRMLGTNKDHLDVRTSIELWSIGRDHHVKDCFAQEDFDLMGPYCVWMRKFKSLGL